MDSQKQHIHACTYANRSTSLMMQIYIMKMLITYRKTLDKQPKLQDRKQQGESGMCLRGDEIAVEGKWGELTTVFHFSPRQQSQNMCKFDRNITEFYELKCQIKISLFYRKRTSSLLYLSQIKELQFFSFPQTLNSKYPAFLPNR